MVKEQAEEDFYFAEAKRMRTEQGIPENEFVHYDTPCTVENQIRMFEASGFKLSRKAWQKGNTVVIVNTK